MRLRTNTAVFLALVYETMLCFVPDDRGRPGTPMDERHHESHTTMYLGLGFLRTVTTKSGRELPPTVWIPHRTLCLPNLELARKTRQKADQVTRRISWGTFQFEDPDQEAISIFLGSTSNFHACRTHTVAYRKAHANVQIAKL